MRQMKEKLMEFLTRRGSRLRMSPPLQRSHLLAVL
jgi:hypothetical protein